MAEFTERTTTVAALIRILKAELNIGIYDEQGEQLFEGRVFKLYDYKEFDKFYIKKMLISFDRVNLVIEEGI